MYKIRYLENFSLGEKGKFLVFIRAFIFYGQLALLNCSEKVIKQCMHLFLSARLKDFSLFEKVKMLSKTRKFHSIR